MNLLGLLITRTVRQMANAASAVATTADTELSMSEFYMWRGGRRTVRQSGSL